MKEYPLDFYTEYSQFYLSDKGASEHIPSWEFWSDDASYDRLAMEKSTLGVMTECYGPVKGKLIVIDNENQNVNLDDYDHVVEAGLYIPSGILQVVDCPNYHVECEVQLTLGIYRARVYSSNLASVDGDEGDDYYTIEIWPDNITERKVLKRYQ